MNMKTKRKLIAVVILLSAMLSACSFDLNCKAEDCDSEVYQDGYCKYHYYLKNGEDFLKDIFNEF